MTEELSKKFPNIISGKRGLGLIQGLVINDDYADAKTLTLKAFDKGLLVAPAGGNVLRIVPPLVHSLWLPIFTCPASSSCILLSMIASLGFTSSSHMKYPPLMLWNLHACTARLLQPPCILIIGLL